MFKFIKSLLILSFIMFISFNVKAIEPQPKFVVSVGTYVSNDDVFQDTIAKQSYKHLGDVYLGFSLFNRLAVYTNDFPFNKGHKVNYNVYNTTIEQRTQIYTTGVLYEVYQDTYKDHEFGFGLSLNRSRIYFNDSVDGKISFNSLCVETLHNYKPKDFGFRLALCPRLWTTEQDKVSNTLFFNIYKNFKI